MGKIAASVLLKLFIYGYERYYTTDRRLSPLQYPAMLRYVPWDNG